MDIKEYNKIFDGKDLVGYHIETWWKLDWPTEIFKCEKIAYYNDEAVARRLAVSEDIGAPTLVRILTKDGKSGIIVSREVSLSDPNIALEKIKATAEAKLTPADREALGLPPKQ